MTWRNRQSPDTEEERRLVAMNDMLNPTSVGMLRLRGGERILDVGCGLGQLTRAIARAAGRGGRVVGVVQGASWIEEAVRHAERVGEGRLAEFRAGDAADLPLDPNEWGTFDLVHARFLLGEVPDPERVVASMVRAARPGGRVVLEDDDHATLRIWPEPQHLEPLWNGFLAACRAQGNDPFVGRRLVSLVHGGGGLPVRSCNLSVSSCAGSPSFKPILGILTAMLRNAHGEIVTRGGLNEAAYQAGMDSFGVFESMPDAAMWYATCWAEGRRPGS